jgi:NADH:ubiquinone oxidoreductase subunit 6 (subunit J)
MWLDLFVFMCLIVGVTSAAMVAFHPNILYAAVSLIFTLLSVAGIYGALGADFLAGAQLIIYVGGIIVVILFAVMMSENIYKTKFIESAPKFLLPALMAMLFMVGFSSLVLSTAWFKVQKPDPVASTQLIGKALIAQYALPFQYVAVVLLAGLIGAVIIARPDYHGAAEKKKVRQ